MRSPRATPSMRGGSGRALVEIGKRNGAVIAEGEGNPAASSWAELDPDFDWNGEIVIGASAPIAEIERATGISEDEPLA